MTLFLRALYTVMVVYFQITVRLAAADATARQDWQEMRARLTVWARPNPRSSWTYRARHGKRWGVGRRRLRAVVQEADIRRIQRGLDGAATALTGEFRRIPA